MNKNPKLADALAFKAQLLLADYRTDDATTVIQQAVKADLREFFLEVPRQTCITKDNAPIDIDFLVYLRVDLNQAEKAVLEVEGPSRLRPLVRLRLPRLPRLRLRPRRLLRSPVVWRAAAARTSPSWPRRRPATKRRFR